MPSVAYKGTGELASAGFSIFNATASGTGLFPAWSSGGISQGPLQFFPNLSSPLDFKYPEERNMILSLYL